MGNQPSDVAATVATWLAQYPLEVTRANSSHDAFAVLCLRRGVAIERAHIPLRQALVPMLALEDLDKITAEEIVSRWHADLGASQHVLQRTRAFTAGHLTISQAF